MEVSYKWLKRYVDFEMAPAEMAEKLTQAGIAVEGYYETCEDISNVVVGQIEKIEAHPDAEKLQICYLNVGDAENLLIVTGAANVAEGQKVPVAQIGATLPQNIKIKKSNLRGVKSFGMLCSGKELDLDEALFDARSQGGILILDQNAPIGADVKEYLELKDTVLELELTPNRSDCLGVINIAREIAAITGNELHLPAVAIEEDNTVTADKIAVEVQDPSLCQRYVAHVIQNVTIEPSPRWMQDCLKGAGIRPINNVVDISNFVMLETGQPLHTFDYDLLKDKKIVVRRAQTEEKMITLDNQERNFSADDLLICDGEKPVAIAGLMGGLSIEVSDQTKNILLEAAHFDPVSIRYTSRRLGLRSDACLRFEKNIDLYQTAAAALRAAQLLQDIAGGKVAQGVVDSNPVEYPGKKVNLSIQKLRDVLGIELEAEEVLTYFKSLEFPVCQVEDMLQVSIPSYRQDITVDVDLIEEVARLKGYDHIPTTLPQGKMTEGGLKEEQQWETKLLDLLNALGLDEVINYSFISDKDILKIYGEQENVPDLIKIQNPLSDEQNTMRTSLLPGILNTAASNINRRNLNLSIFETGKVFCWKENQIVEKKKLALLLSGQRQEGWLKQEEEVDFFHLKGILAEMMDMLGIKDWKLQVEGVPSCLHPGKSAVLYVKENKVGFLGEVHPALLEKFDLGQRCYYLELELLPIIKEGVKIKKYKPVAKFPAVDRDLALVVPENVQAGAVEEMIWQEGGKYLAEVSLFDLYEGEKMEAGHKGLAYALKFQKNDSTLKDKEISKRMDKIIAVLETMGVSLR